LAGHDYAAAGWCFITICTAEREPFFGEVRAGVMGLNAAGCIAHDCWAAIPDHILHVRLDAFIVMPNHVHGLVGVLPPLGDAEMPSQSVAGSTKDETMRTVRLGTRPGSVSAVVRSYKAAVTKAVRLHTPEFQWQPRFHDHVVRNELAMTRIRTYIQANPTTWSEDRLHPANGGML